MQLSSISLALTRAYQAVGGGGAQWILSTGLWNDAQFWADDQTWRDLP